MLDIAIRIRRTETGEKAAIEMSVYSIELEIGANDAGRLIATDA